MRLTKPLMKLPIRFCAETLAAETRALPPSAWVPHPTGFEGNDAALLVTPGGRIDQGFVGPHAMTEHLRRSLYMQQVMAEIGAVWGRSRLMGLAPGASVQPHIDTHYYWRTHWRLHIPVISNPDVLFTCGDATVHMAPGECWIFDSFLPHQVHNGGDDKRVHLVLDTVGGGILWELIARANAGSEAPVPEPRAPGSAGSPALAFEQLNAPTVMSPWEIRCHIAYLAAETVPGPQLTAVVARLDLFVDLWAAAWAQYGESPLGFATFQRLVASARDDLYALGADALKLRNGLSLFTGIRELVFRMAVPRPEQPQAGMRAVRGGSAGTRSSTRASFLFEHGR